MTSYNSWMLILVAVAMTEATDLLVTSRPVYVRMEQLQKQDQILRQARQRQEESVGLAQPSMLAVEQTGSSNRKIETDEDPAQGVWLGRDFLKLFDEILRIKKLTSTALKDLVEEMRQQRQPITITPPLTNPEDTETNDGYSTPEDLKQQNLLSTSVSIGFGLHQKPFKLLQQQRVNSTDNMKQQMSSSSPVGLLGAWFQQLNSKINRAMQVVLAKPLMQKRLLLANVKGEETIQDDADTSTGGRSRRQAKSEERELVTEGCVPLNQEQMNECRFAELQVGTVMNSSFPFSPAAIEDNCRHVTFLLTNCWPEQLQLIRLAITSGGWNESSLQTSEFQLPALDNGGEQEAEKPTSCGLKPQLSEQVLDRISWMWLNFCMDKKFRHDYLDHMRCLSFWSQDRAHAVCPTEWRLIQNGPNYLPLAGTKQRGRQKISQFPQVEPAGEVLLTTVDYTISLSNASTTTLASSGRHVTQELQTRDLESKTICCMFDLFLRCVYRQALRDCGRTGSQLVVNFMARIGTDDMKWVCNANHFAAVAASKTRPPQQAGPRRNNQVLAVTAAPSTAEQSLGASPFIERPYCNDPRINQALRNQATHTNGNEMGKFPGNDHHQHQRHKPSQGGRTNTRGPIQTNNSNRQQDLDGAEMALADSASSLHNHHLLLLVVTSIAHFLYRL